LKYYFILTFYHSVVVVVVDVDVDDDACCTESADISADWIPLFSPVGSSTEKGAGNKTHFDKLFLKEPIRSQYNLYL